MSDCLTVCKHTHTHTDTACYTTHKGHSLIYGSSDKCLSQTWASSTATGANTSSLSLKACIRYGHGLLVVPVIQCCGRGKSCLAQRQEANMLLGCEQMCLQKAWHTACLILLPLYTSIRAEKMVSGHSFSNRVRQHGKETLRICFKCSCCCLYTALQADYNH